MPIPDTVLAVERPTNTVVIVYGKDKDLYAVRQRIGCRNVNGRHIPVNGPTIGHIIDGVYVPIGKAGSLSSVSGLPVDLKDWANVALCNRLFEEIYAELLKVYNEQDALKLSCIAIIRVCEPGIKDYELKEAYGDGFLSELHPGVALSKNTVSKFLNGLGKASSHIRKFMKNRADAVRMDHHLLVDGTLKSDESKVNSLSDFSYKAKTKGTRDISVVYAFDLESMEPVCSMAFPGNMLDITAYESFIRENGIHKGIIVADKGFPSAAAEQEFRDNPELHYLNPVKRNSKLAERHNLLDFNAILPGYDEITCRKEKCVGSDKWLYSFRDSHTAAKEEQDWLKRAKKDGTYDLQELRRRQRTFGTVVLECDLDIPSEVVYKAYSERWKIETVMRYYKSACEFDETRVQDDYSVIGSEFIDFLSTLLTFRLLNEFEKYNLLNTMTYKRIMSILQRAKKFRTENGNWQLIKINPSYEVMLQTLGLLPKPDEPPKKKRGRPRKVRV